MRIHLRVLLAGMLLLLAGGLALVLADSPGTLSLSGAETITAGDAWALDIEVSGGEPGEELSVLLLHGLRRYSTTLALGSGGIARWTFPEGELTAAGTSLAIIRFVGQEARFTLTVLPAEPDTLDLLTTANALIAYGSQRGMLMAVAADAWGNPVDTGQPVRLRATFPDGGQLVRMVRLDDGLGWVWQASDGPPGRLHVEGTLAAARAELEILQMPGAASQIDVRVLPPCLPYSDGRDMVTLQAIVQDAHEQPVVDGTRVIFRWGDSTGAAPTVAGVATLSIPAPEATGEYTVLAAAGQAEGGAPLNITAGICP